MNEAEYRQWVREKLGPKPIGLKGPTPERLAEMQRENVAELQRMHDLRIEEIPEGASAGHEIFYYDDINKQGCYKGPYPAFRGHKNGYTGSLWKRVVLADCQVRWLYCGRDTV